MDYVCLLITASFLSGALSGLFGIGGGIVMVPILFKAFQLMGINDGICMNVAMGTSLGVVSITSAMSFMAHKRLGTVDMRVLKDWAIVLPLTAVLTTLMLSRVNNDFINKIFSIFYISVGLLILVKDRWSFKYDFSNSLLKYFWGIITGFLSGALGVGGGIFSAILMLLHGRSINQAIAISTGVSVMIAVPGLIIRMYNGWNVEGTPPMSIGFVNIGAIILILPISIVVTPIATKISYMIKKKYLEVGFSIIMFLVALSFI